MGNEVGIVASLEVSGTLTATFEDDYCSIHLSITFKLTITVFAALPEERPAAARKPALGISPQKYQQYKMFELQDICKDWEQYLTEKARAISARTYLSMEELREPLQEIQKRQMQEKCKIERIIEDVYNDMNRVHLDDEKLGDILLLLSNCYQAIRDLSVEIAIGPRQFLDITSPISDECVKIQDELMAKYGQHKLMNYIKERKDISESIIETREKISNLNAEYWELVDEQAKVQDVQNVYARLKQEKEQVVPAIKEFVPVWNAFEETSLKKRLAILEAEIEACEGRIAELSQRTGVFVKKKAQAAIAEITRLLEDRKTEKAALEKRLKDKTYSISGAQVDKRGILSVKKAPKPVDDTQLQKVSDELVKLRKELENMLTKYEKCMEHFIPKD